MEREAEVIQTTREYFDSNAKDYDNSPDGRFVRCMYQEIVDRAAAKNPTSVLDKTTIRLIQKHDNKSAAKPPFLGGFFIFGASAA